MTVKMIRIHIFNLNVSQNYQELQIFSVRKESSENIWFRHICGYNFNDISFMCKPTQPRAGLCRTMLL